MASVRFRASVPCSPLARCGPVRNKMVTPVLHVLPADHPLHSHSNDYSSAACFQGLFVRAKVSPCPTWPYVDEAFLQSTAAKNFLACGALKVLFIIACGGPRAHDFSGISFRCHSSWVSGSTSSSSNSSSGDGPGARPLPPRSRPVSCPPGGRRRERGGAASRV